MRGASHILESDVFTEASAAAFLHLKPATLRAWRTVKKHAGKAPAFIQQGRGRVLYLRSDLDAWLIANRKKPRRRATKVSHSSKR